MKKQAYRFLSFMLSFIMVISMIPTVSAMAATEISSVELSVTAPVGNFNPDYTVKMPVDANYEVLAAFEIEGFIVDGVFWQTTTGGSSGSGVGVSQTDTFTAGTEYNVTIYLVAKEGYEFSSSVTGKINNNNGSIFNNIDESVKNLAPGRDIITISYTFTAGTPTEYDITSGDNGEFNKQGTAEEMSFTADADIDNFRGIEVDGNKVDSSNYTAESGSTIVNLKGEYLKTLDNGEHTLKMLFSDGAATANFTIINEEVEVKTVTIPVLKYVSNLGNVKSGAKDFTVSMKLMDSTGAEVEGFVVTDNIISSDGTHTNVTPYEDSVSFTVPEEVYSKLSQYTLEVKENPVSEKGWVTDSNTLSVSFIIREDGSLTFDCDGINGDMFDESVVPNIVFSNSYTIYEIEIPVEETIKVSGQGTAPDRNFEIEAYILQNPERENNYINGSIGTKIETVTNNSIATNGEGTYNTTMKITLDGTEFVPHAGTMLLVKEKNTDEDDWTSTGMQAWLICITPEPSINSMDELSDTPVAEEAAKLEGYVIDYYIAWLNFDSTYSAEVSYPVGRDVAMFENTYSVPTNVVFEIPFTKTVEVEGNTKEARDFEFDLIVPNTQEEIDMKVEGTTVSTDGAGSYEGKITVTVAEEDLSKLMNGLVLTEKNTGAEGWTYDETAWWISLNIIKVSSLDEDRPTEPLSDYTLTYNIANKVEENSYRPTNEIKESIVFTNTFVKEETTVVTHTVTFDSVGGSEIDPQFVDDGALATEPSAPTKSGYTFVKWTLNGDDYDFGTPVTEDITLVAVWKAKTTSQPVVIPRGTAKLTKVDADNDKIVIPGVVFELRREDNSRVGTYTTDEKGKIYVFDIPVGKYYWVEVKAADGYILDNTKHFFKVVEAKITEEIVTNEKAVVPQPTVTSPFGTAKLTKVDAEDRSVFLPGAVFALYAENGTYIGSYTTDENGEITVKDLPVGKYYWVEISAPEGYVSETVKHNFAVSRFFTAKVVISNEKAEEIHEHNEETVNGYDPTCTETGLTNGTVCTNCGEIIDKQEIIPAKGHVPGDVVVENVIEATETIDGSYELVTYCSVCNEEISRIKVTVPATGEIENPETADESTDITVFVVSSVFVMAVCLVTVIAKRYFCVK